MGVVLLGLVLLLVLVTGVKQSQLLVSRLRLKFDINLSTKIGGLTTTLSLIEV